ncbi:MAG: sigma-E processing peptidase SpoIIGA [bacterium]|nr:sigma-E processing peptidase SpoIIGA [bacterium]
MEVVVYIDELWLRSCLFGIGISIFLKIWMKQQAGTVRLVIVRFLQTTAGVGLFVISGFGVWYQIGCILFELFGLHICFHPGKASVFFRMVLWDLIATVAAGGILNLLATYLPGNNSLFLESAVVFLGIMVSIILEERRTIQDLRLYDVWLMHQDRKLQIRALYDTGNRLSDPYVHRPVSILSEKAIETLGLADEKSRLVPYHCINGENELIQVWTIDCVKIGKTTVHDAVVGKTGNHIFKGKEYEMILPAGLFYLISDRKESRRNCYVHKD